MKFASELRRLRLKFGMTQGDLAIALKISRSAISMYENGDREPDFETIEKIADYFNVSIANLMDDTADSSYYTNPETAAIAQEIFDDKELRALMSAARDADPKAIKMAHDLLVMMKRQERHDDDNGL